MTSKKNSSRKKEHPSLDIVSSYGTELSGRNLVLCVAGSVAAYKAIELARLLMRHGANVTCVASNAVTKLVQPDYFKWATGNNVITNLTGELEHIRLADYNKSDLIIVYPATANTLGKLANGIDDTPISTVLTVAFGSKIPILMCLAMHESMHDNAAVKKNIEFLKNKIEFLQPLIIEGKAKAPEPENVLDYVLRKFGFSSLLKNKKVLLTAGSTIEYIDPVRVITNQSSGKTGVLLASQLISAGANVTLVYGRGTETPPNGAKIIRVSTGEEMMQTLKKIMKKKFDIVIMAAAISDFTPEKLRRKKLKSQKEEIIIRLKRTTKILDQIKKYQKKVFLVGFKAEANISKNNLIKIARKKLLESSADLIVANDIGTTRYKKNPNFNEILIVDSKKVVSSGWVKKEKIAKLIRNEIEKRLKNEK